MTTLCRQIKYRIRQELRGQGALLVSPRRRRRGSYRTIFGTTREKTLVPNRICGLDIRQELNLAAKSRRQSPAQKRRLAAAVRLRASNVFENEVNAAVRGLTGVTLRQVAATELLAHILASTPVLRASKLGAAVRAFRRLKRRNIWGNRDSIEHAFDDLLVRYLNLKQLCSLAQGLAEEASGAPLPAPPAPRLSSPPSPPPPPPPPAPPSPRRRRSSSARREERFITPTGHRVDIRSITEPTHNIPATLPPEVPAPRPIFPYSPIASRTRSKSKRKSA